MISISPARWRPKRLYFIITLLFSKVGRLARMALLATGYRSRSGTTRRKVRLVVFGVLIGLTPLLLHLISEVLGGVGWPYYLTLIGLVAMLLAYCLSLNYEDLIEAGKACDQINLVSDLQAQLERSEADRQELRQAYARLLEVREAEQKRIVRELYDEVIQTVYGFTLFIQRARQQVSVGKTEELGLQLADLQRQTVEISRTACRICHDLRPDALRQLGLSGVLRSLAKKTANRGELDVKTVINPPNIRLNEETSIALYRIVQESLNNVIKHAQANLVTVHLSVTDVATKLMIEDDGIGFDPASVEGKRLGLIGIRERVRALDGTLTIHSQIGKGTTLRVQI